MGFPPLSPTMVLGWSCSWFTSRGHNSIFKADIVSLWDYMDFEYNLREMLRVKTNNSCGKPPKCHVFSSLRQTLGLVMMKLELWIKRFIISLIYVQDISQNPRCQNLVSELKRTDSVSKIELLFITKPSPISIPRHWEDVWFKWELSSRFRLSSEPCDKGAEPPRGLVWRKRGRPLPSSSVTPVPPR